MKNRAKVQQFFIYASARVLFLKKNIEYHLFVGSISHYRKKTAKVNEKFCHVKKKL